MTGARNLHHGSEGAEPLTDTPEIHSDDEHLEKAMDKVFLWSVAIVHQVVCVNKLRLAAGLDERGWWKQ